MPRPKRSKVVPSALTKLPHQRVPQQSVTASAAQRQKDFIPPASSGRNNNTSDDSDGLVVARREGRTTSNVKPQEYTMSGALAVDDLGTSNLKPPSSKMRAELMRVTRDAERARVSQGESSRGVAVHKVGPENPEQIPSSVPEESNVTRQDLHRSSSKQTPMRQNIHVQSRSKLQATPRVPSMTKGHSTFKKRARQPSLLQVAQSQQHTLLDLDADDDNLYNFLPDDESTPLTKSLSQPHAQATPSSTDQTSGSRKRKRPTPEIQVPASQNPLESSPSQPSPVASPSHIAQQDDLSGLFTEDDQPQPSLPRHRSAQTPPLHIFSDTLAPPQSSSPAGPRPKATQAKSTKPSHKSKSQKQQRKHKEGPIAQSPLSSTSAQISPVRSVKKTKPLTTATLQNMLPRRRARGRPKGDYDVPSSSDVELDNTGLGEDEDEDELSFHVTKVRKKKSGMNAAKRGAKKKETVSKKTQKTYARKSIAVSEDEDDENDSISGGNEGNENVTGRGKKASGLDSKAKAEMKRLAEKFREVDEYTLDFEDMTGSSSQMKDAR